ncbi:MAG: helix-turn-helix transcriptional regulator [Oscillibacter sp.]|nr:helix-turn-helix transcriptional regulator [Oscillibacter sp.]
MEQQSMGQIITKLRKERGMTQKELAERMHVTDKAVSKWERDLSCPDVGSLPQLAQELGVGVEVLLNTQPSAPPRAESVVDTVLKVIPLALGAAVVTLSTLQALDAQTGLTLLGVGMFSQGLFQLKAR